MKEYLEKQADGSYKLVMLGIVRKDDDIEVPEGAEIYALAEDGIKTFWSDKYQWRDGKITRRIEGEDKDYTFKEWQGDWGATILWQREKESIIDKLVDDGMKFDSDKPRHTQPEELPFMDSLNDQYAEIEQVRKHRHYFKDVSNIAEIDVYAVLKLFEVTDPCLQHIVKKALCAGKRGHKDMMEDLQNIVDTAIRAVELNS